MVSSDGWSWILSAVRHEMASHDQAQSGRLRSDLLDILSPNRCKRGGSTLPETTGTDQPDLVDSSEDSTMRLIQAVMAAIRANYQDQLTTARLARSVGLTRAMLSEHFGRFAGSTVRAYINTVRLHNAMAMVLRGDKIEAVVLSAGYRSKVTFYRHFVEATGLTPAEFRRRHASSSCAERSKTSVVENRRSIVSLPARS
jgi:AraC-like DNA-binding protein